MTRRPFLMVAPISPKKVPSGLSAAYSIWSFPTGATYHVGFTNTMIVPRHWSLGSGHRKGSRVTPTIRPVWVAFMATPGVEDEVIGSPGAMGPFSAETL